jgi:hypothetical protein
MESPSVSKARPGSTTRLPIRGTRRGRRSPYRWVAQVTALLVSSLIWLVTGTAAWHRPIITSMTLWPIPGLQWRPCRCLSTGLPRLALARKNSWLVGATRTLEAQPRSKSVLQLRRERQPRLTPAPTSTIQLATTGQRVRIRTCHTRSPAAQQLGMSC